MNPITDVTVRQVATQASSKPEPTETEATTQSVRQEGNAVIKARESAEAQRAAVSEARLEQVIEQINAQAQGLSPSLRFEPDADSGIVVIKVMNRETGEVIRQLPPEAVVKAAETGEVLPALVDASA